jgi:mannose-6-phosphate isomerase-like protein (cupin superfamily)
MAYEKINFEQIDDSAEPSGMTSLTARFAREGLGAERIGLAHYAVKPGARIEFGHRHRRMEEVYVVLSGTGTFRVDDETFDVAPRDVVRPEPQSWRGWEAGADGMELLAFGEHIEGDGESDLDMAWWPKD